jgi:DNA-binding transcriptional ArsR family regulator
MAQRPPRPKRQRREATPEEFKALAHPLRLRILRLCLHDSLTNKQIADQLGKDPATVLHHVRLLVDTGFLAAETPRPGARGALSTDSSQDFPVAR